ncbi:MAG: helicase-related protein, partial [Pseudomonadota bacterium]
MPFTPAPARGVTAVLGPTNTGKTHLAIERMLGHQSGLIGLPLRLLAREVYDRVVARVGAAHVALITGEEKIKPPRARYWVCTVEAMPQTLDVAFVAIDEVQLAADPERGHVFTNRFLNARGTQETLLLGSDTMRSVISDTLPGANFVARPRLSRLSYAGQKKVSRLPRRTAIVAFSAAEVYAIAELIRRQRGGAAVVMGALSPRTRNAQVELYQSEEVDFLVATDAIGMGLNLNVGHVAFAATRKFDGQRMRNLTHSEMAQIAGRAGRHMNDGTFGVTGDTDPFEQDTVEALENHTFEPVKMLQWRNAALDYSSVPALRASLNESPGHARLARARTADDVITLEAALRDDEVSRLAVSPAAIKRLWDVCQVPDYRKISASTHAELVVTLYRHLLSPQEKLPEDWFAQQVAQADRTDGDIDTLATRLAHMRTWTFIANRADWLDNPDGWQQKTREIEDKLSDALHDQLTQRFVDRRTSTLMKSLRDSDELFAEISDDGAIHVEKHYVGRLMGLRYIADADADGAIDAKASRNAAAHVLSKELTMRTRRIASAKSDAFRFDMAGAVFWRDQEIAKLLAGDTPLAPRVSVLADEHLSGPDKEKIQARLDKWIRGLIDERAKPLVMMAGAGDTSGMARGVAFQLVEAFGILKRADVSDDIRSMDQTSRGQLRRFGVRFGAFNIYFPVLLKPAATELLVLLWRLNAGKIAENTDALPAYQAPRAGLTSAAADPQVPEAFYRVAGYHICGPRLVRVDMLERLADMIRPLVAWRKPAGAAVSNANADHAAKTGEVSDVTPPAGATGDGGFTVQADMMSILGCSADEVGAVLKSLGFRLDRRQMKAERKETAAPDMNTAASESADVAALEVASPHEATTHVADTTEAETPPAARDGH